MSRSLHLTRDEAAVVSPILARLSRTAGFPLALNRLLADWAQFVAEVERGYGRGVYDYENDLSVRDLLEQVLTQAPAVTHEKIVAVIRPWDRRFVEATRHAPSRHDGTDGAHAGPTDRWWWGRIPRRWDGEQQRAWPRPHEHAPTIGRPLPPSSSEA